MNCVTATLIHWLLSHLHRWF